MANTFTLEADVNADVDLQASGASSAATVYGTADAAEALRANNDLFGIISQPPALEEQRVRITLNRLTLDGDSAGVYTGGILNIPVGFNPVTAQIDGFFQSSGGSDAYNNANTTIYLQSHAFTETQVTRVGGFTVPQTVSLSVSGGAIGLINDGLGWRYTRVEALGAVYLNVDRLQITGTYTIDAFQWYLEEIEEVYERIPFKRNVLTQVFDGDEPPEGAVPFGPPDVTPTYEWWSYTVGDIILYLYQPVSPGTLWVLSVAPTNYGWWKSFEEFLGGALLIVNGNPKKPRTFEQITDFSDFMGGFPGAGATLNHRLIYAAKDT